MPAGTFALDPAPKCEAAKLNEAAKKAKCVADVAAKSIKQGEPVDSVKLGKCSTKFDEKFAKSEATADGACPTTGDAASIESTIDTCVDGVIVDLGGAPGAGGDEAKCQSMKAREAGKYAQCRFKASAKGVKKSLPPDFTKCEEKLTVKWGKLEAKPPCATTGDLTAVQADLDACHADVAESLTGNCGNGSIDAGEECDDGDLVNGDGCSDQCESEFACGDGSIDAGEECDDGDLVNGNGCSDACALEGTVEYSQDFEALNQASGSALSDNGWLVGANVFAGPPPGGGLIYNYFSFPAPNGGPAFSAIASGEGGAGQGAQQLSIYSDYNNADHGNGNTIEALVFRERTIVAGDVGKTLTFLFDAKLGNLELQSTAEAFIKTIDPGNGYATTNLVTVDTTSIPATWGRFSIKLEIDAPLVGQILQYGFGSRATSYQGSGIFYDNLVVASVGGAPPPVCGDGTMEGSEQCDDGDLDNGDGCDDQCNLEPVAGEYAINGDFETGDKTGWTEFLNNGTFDVSGANTNGGSWAGHLVASVPGGGGPASFPVIKQANLGAGSMVPGGTVTVQFDLNGSLTGAGGVVFAELFSEISGGGVSKSEIITGAPLFPNAPKDWTAGWVSYSFNLTLGPDVSGGVTLQLKADCGANPGCTVDLYLDNVSVSVP